MHKTGNYIVIALTIILFVVSVFVKGFTHELLIEAGVLLVSVKLIMMNQRMSIKEQEILTMLSEIKKELERKNAKSS